MSLVRVAGDVDTGVVAELRAALETALAEHPRIIMDLTRAATIDSVGLGTVVRARQAARRRGGDLLLAAPSRFVQTVLHTMRLDGAFPPSTPCHKRCPLRAQSRRLLPGVGHGRMRTVDVTAAH
ncbi:STAS domain-containing protein [Jidongwangia harbinensis]|uniref:STAS domain-containing protein n=1 Tax=Jidongwangia harbinensis TaxID=2878561 RepID=UPI001CD9B095|nr:STAS domain-containing protein [Jidongwangia harbinensis]MCA2219044.1 STAS domain-containing protein [Jidongwangia harbinensis]